MNHSFQVKYQSMHNHKTKLYYSNIGILRTKIHNLFFINRRFFFLNSITSSEI